MFNMGHRGNVFGDDEQMRTDKQKQYRCRTAERALLFRVGPY
jgi:hypothetical protein